MQYARLIRRGRCARPVRPAESAWTGAIAWCSVRNRGGLMRAVTVVPGTAGSLRIDEVPEPAERVGSVLVEALAVGICGTDVEIAEGSYGWPPPERDRLILGH